MKKLKLSENEAVWKSQSINFLECCDCSLVHAIYIKVLPNGKIYLNFERDDMATESMRKKDKIKITKKGKKVD